MAIRRPFTGKPLLVTTAGIALSVVACSGGKSGPKDDFGPTGNLVAPPTVQVCVTVEPAEAKVQVQGIALDSLNCIDIYGGSAQVIAEAEGYEKYDETVDVPGEGAQLTIKLIPLEAAPAP